MEENRFKRAYLEYQHEKQLEREKITTAITVSKNRFECLKDTAPIIQKTDGRNAGRFECLIIM
jgi:hypothetical protein